jgi:hypothetical protein
MSSNALSDLTNLTEQLNSLKGKKRSSAIPKPGSLCSQPIVDVVSLQRTINEQQQKIALLEEENNEKAKSLEELHLASLNKKVDADDDDDDDDEDTVPLEEIVDIGFEDKKELEDEIECLTTNLVENNKTICTLKEECTLKDVEICSNKKEIEENEVKIIEMETKQHKLTQEIIDKDTFINNIKDDKNESNDKFQLLLKKSEQDCIDKESKLTELNASLTSVKLDLATITIESTNKDTNITKLEQDLNEIKIKLVDYNEVVSKLESVSADNNEITIRLKKSQEEMSLVNAEGERCSEELVMKVSELTNENQHLLLNIKVNEEKNIENNQKVCDMQRIIDSLEERLNTCISIEEHSNKINEVVQSNQKTVDSIQKELLNERNKLEETNVALEVLNIKLEETTTTNRTNLENIENDSNLLKEKNLFLETEISLKDDTIAEIENELFQLRQEIETSSSSSVDANSNSTISSTIKTDSDTIEELQKEIVEKNERIVHLEKSKLTKDQVEKIKQVKLDKVRLNSENQKLKTKIEGLEERIKIHKDDARNSREEISNLNESLKRLANVSNALGEEEAVVVEVVQAEVEESVEAITNTDETTNDVVNKNNNQNEANIVDETIIKGIKITPPIQENEEEEENNGGFAGQEKSSMNNSSVQEDVEKECTQQ